MSPTKLVGFETTAAGGAIKAVSPDTPLPVTLPAAGSPVTFATTAAVALKPATTPGTGGLTTSYTAAQSSTKTAIVAVPATLYGWQINNPNAAVSYVQVFNKLTANVTVGTTTPDFVIGIAASGFASFSIPQGIDLSIGLVIAATTTIGGSTAPATQALPVALFYK
jgi:hypothetical protein